MDEEEFDSLMPWRPFGTKDAQRADAEMRRSSMLGVALWGGNSADLQRQLLAPHPEIPAGFDLADFHRLHRTTQMIATKLRDPRLSWLPHGVASSATISVGAERITEWEARCEIVRRAIEYLEKR